MKVAQVGRRIAERLKIDDETKAIPAVIELDPDGVQAAGLAHDLGHPPFGHLAEEELNTIAADIGGFEGNAQTFRILTRLSRHRLDCDGLNLTRRTLNYVMKYPWMRDQDDGLKSRKWGAYDSDGDAFNWVRLGELANRRSLGAEIMDWADDLTFAIHDVEDFYRAGLVPLERFGSVDEQKVFIDSLFEDGADRTKLRESLQGDGVTLDDILEAAADLMTVLTFEGPFDGSVPRRASLKRVMSELMDRYIKAISVAETEDGFKVEISKAVRAQVGVLKRLTWCYVIDRPSLALIQEGQRRIIRGLFEAHFDKLQGDSVSSPLLPPNEAALIADGGTEASRKRILVDYIAGMSEAQAMSDYRRIMGDSLGASLYA